MKSTRKIKIIYTGGQDNDLDKRIELAMIDIGVIWIDQGFGFITGNRGTRKIKVTYTDGQDNGLDKRIKLAMKDIGAKWIGQGFDFITGNRDIGFEITERRQKK